MALEISGNGAEQLSKKEKQFAEDFHGVLCEILSERMEFAGKNGIDARMAINLIASTLTSLQFAFVGNMFNQIFGKDPKVELEEFLYWGDMITATTNILVEHYAKEIDAKIAKEGKQNPERRSKVYLKVKKTEPNRIVKN